MNLNHRRFTGGLGMVLTGFAMGIRDLVKLERSAEGVSAALILAGAALGALGFWSV